MDSWRRSSADGAMLADDRLQDRPGDGKDADPIQTLSNFLTLNQEMHAVDQDQRTASGIRAGKRGSLSSF